MTALEAALKPGPWLFGDQFTAADLYIASGLGFGMQFGMIDKRPAFVAVRRTRASPPRLQTRHRNRSRTRSPRT